MILGVAACLAAATTAQAATVTFELVIDTSTNTFELFASTPIEAGNQGIAGYNIALANIATATSNPPRGFDSALFVTRGFTVTPNTLTLAGPGSLFAGQSVATAPNVYAGNAVVLGIGQTSGTMNTFDKGSFTWDAKYSVGTGTYVGSTLPAFGVDAGANVVDSSFGPAFVHAATIEKIVTVVPEPMTLGLLAFGAMGLLLKRRHA
jgi:hypothetical protein